MGMKIHIQQILYKTAENVLMNFIGKAHSNKEYTRIKSFQLVRHSTDCLQ